MPEADILSRLDSALQEETGIAPESEAPDEEIVQEAEAAEPTGEKEPVEGSPNSDEESEEVVEEEIHSLSDLATHLGVDVADLYNVTLPVTAPDGSKREVTLGEWKDAFQEHEALRSERRKFEDQVQKAQTEIVQKAQNLDAAYIQADSMIKTAEKQILGEIDGPEMIQLRASNPAEYAAKKQEYKERLAELQNMRQQAITGYQQQMQENHQKMEAQRQEYLRSQAALLPQLIPEWRDEKTRESERSELSQYLVSAGFPQQQVDSIDNASIVAIARKAMLWDKQQKSNPAAKKKVLSIGGKVLKSGKAPTKVDRKQAEYQKDRAAVKKAATGHASEKAAQALIEKYFLD